LVDRDEALASVVRSFGIGGALALLLTSVSGYLIARAGLGPVEAMRRRAQQMSLTRTDDDLPLPAADDEIRRLGQTLNEMLARLRESFARESRFVADASHELRTPVAVIKTELEAAVQVGDHGPTTREGLLTALEECDRLGQLAEDLLVLARTADGHLPVRCALVPITPLLCGVRDRFVDRASERGRAITVTGDGGRAWVDPERVRQALSNLVDNALRHGVGVIRLHVRRRGSEIEFEVHDDGPGFPEPFVARAFERFSRGDSARMGVGAGLGLAIVDTIAAAHGGRAAIAPGQGCTVRMWLPNVETANRRD
jgi:signal transduction histidine kinase